MIAALSAAALVSAALAIAADWNERRHRAFYVLKPLTTLLIIAVAAAAQPFASPYQQWILLALLLSLVGDVCLMFAGGGWFLGGLGSFLLAHLAFVAAFLHGVADPAPPWWSYAVLPAAALMLWALLPRAGAMRVPVLVYCVVLAAMTFAAGARYAASPGPEALLAVAGALTFMVSDSLLGWRKFVGPFPGAQALILATYWLAIWLIALSV